MSASRLGRVERLLDMSSEAGAVAHPAAAECGRSPLPHHRALGVFRERRLESPAAQPHHARWSSCLRRRYALDSFRHEDGTEDYESAFSWLSDGANEAAIASLVAHAAEPAGGSALSQTQSTWGGVAQGGAKWTKPARASDSNDLKLLNILNAQPDTGCFRLATLFARVEDLSHVRRSNSGHEFEPGMRV